LASAQWAGARISEQFHDALSAVDRGRGFRADFILFATLYFARADGRVCDDFAAAGKKMERGLTNAK
jgi:hypothetical protein